VNNRGLILRPGITNSSVLDYGIQKRSLDYNAYYSYDEIRNSAACNTMWANTA